MAASAARRVVTGSSSACSMRWDRPSTSNGLHGTASRSSSAAPVNSDRTSDPLPPVHSEQQGPAGELLAESLDFLAGLPVAGEAGELGRVDGDRRARRGDHPLIRHFDRRAGDLDARAAQQAPARLEEVRAVALGVEGDDVRAEQPEQDLLPPWQAGEDVR